LPGISAPAGDTTADTVEIARRWEEVG
jgi:hypothetical protein